MPPALHATLVGLAARLSDARDHWWIITGAAAALHGASADVADVDVLASEADAARLFGDDAVAGTPGDRYRSTLFGRIDRLPLPVEIMAGFELLGDDGWRPVRFATREAVAVDDAMLFVPGRDELVVLLTALGRPKDLARIVMLTS